MYVTWIAVCIHMCVFWFMFVLVIGVNGAVSFFRSGHASARLKVFTRACPKRRTPHLTERRS